MEHSGDASFDSANRRVRILGWLTIALAVAPQAVLLVWMVIIALSPRSGAGGPIGSSSFDLGICCFLAIVTAPWTLGLCLTARGLFRHRPLARRVTLGLTVVVFVLTLIVGGWVSFFLQNELTAHRRDFVHQSPEWDPIAGRLVEKRVHQVVEPESHVRRSYRQQQALAILPFLVCSPYCILAHLWLWNRPVRALFGNSSHRESSGVKSA